MSGTLLAAALLLAFASGIPTLFLKHRPSLGQKLATALLIAGSLAGLTGAALVLAGYPSGTATLGLDLPFGPLEAAADPLSALFLLPIFAVSLCCAVYAVRYWPAEAYPDNFRKLSVFFGILTASLALLVMARGSIPFLMAWEVMAFSCYFVLTTDDAKPEVRDAGLLYLITTHIGTLALFGMFSLLRVACGSYGFPASGTLEAGCGIGAAIFVTALIGFGLKAGLMPLHVWLPSAHANAPSHVSAIMSGVLIKMGIYGLVRTLSFFSHIPLWWGATVLVTGIVSGILGVAFAIAQHDMKRLLAYHSIENIGIIAMGIGVALIGETIGNPLLVLLGMAGALLHVMNHATFKALLFLCAGSVIHAVRTREIDLMGGLARPMPWTAGCFLVGAVAICGLPPLNGFVSEFLIYLGIFSGVKAGNSAGVPFLALAAPALAVIGGLAVACFVKVYGVAFLGLPRSEEAAVAHEAPREMRVPMGVLAAICIFIGILPPAVAPVVEKAVRTWNPAAAAAGEIGTSFPLWWLTALNLVLLLLALGGALFFLGRVKKAPLARGTTWDCGYLRPSPRMQYTASSFAEMLIRIFAGVLRPHRRLPEIAGPFPKKSRFSSHVPETALELVFLPFLERANERIGFIRRLQHGQLHLYISYTFVALVLLLIWARYS